MFIFKSAFSATSKKTNKPYYNVSLFEKRSTQDGSPYFKELSLFVEKNVFDDIVENGFNFGDVVEVKLDKPEYLGGPERLIGLELLEESPYL